MLPWGLSGFFLLSTTPSFPLLYVVEFHVALTCFIRLKWVGKLNTCLNGISHNWMNCSFCLVTFNMKTPRISQVKIFSKLNRTFSRSQPVSRHLHLAPWLHLLNKCVQKSTNTVFSLSNKTPHWPKGTFGNRKPDPTFWPPQCTT